MPQNPTPSTLFVTKVEAGSNVTLSPSSGTGIVTISVGNGAGGVSSVTAGTGISASGSTGAVTLSVASGYVESIIQSNVPAVRYLPLTGAKADTGVALTGTATGGAMGVSRTAGTSLVLVGEATSASAKTDKALWEFDLPDTYVSGSTVPIVVNANYTGGGTVTAASTTLTVNAYTEVNGVETALTGITAAQQFTGTATNYTFTIPAAGLAIGTHLVVEIVMLVTTSAGAATGQINSVGFTA